MLATLVNLSVFRFVVDYPHGVMSRFKQRVLKLFGRAYFTEAQLSAFNELRDVTDAFLEAFTAHGLSE